MVQGAGRGKGGDIAVQSTGGDLRQELAYCNHQSVRKYEGEGIKKVMSVVAVGRVMVSKVDGAERI